MKKTLNNLCMEQPSHLHYKMLQRIYLFVVFFTLSGKYIICSFWYQVQTENFPVLEKQSLQMCNSVSAKTWVMEYTWCVIWTVCRKFISSFFMLKALSLFLIVYETLQKKQMIPLCVSFSFSLFFSLFLPLSGLDSILLDQPNTCTI